MSTLYEHVKILITQSSITRFRDTCVPICANVRMELPAWWVIYPRVHHRNSDWSSVWNRTFLQSCGCGLSWTPDHLEHRSRSKAPLFGVVVETMSVISHMLECISEIYNGKGTSRTPGSNIKLLFYVFQNKSQNTFFYLWGVEYTNICWIQTDTK